MTADTSLHNAHDDLLERFLAAFNSIDKLLKTCLREEESATFHELVKKYKVNHKTWKEDDFLKAVAKLRNVIIHEKTKPHQNLAIPTSHVVDRVEQILKNLEKPALALSLCNTNSEVVCVEPDEMLISVLDKIYRLNYSQFPIYRDHQFEGLLTENGITRWLSKHVTKVLSLIEFEDVTVSQLFIEEEQRENWKFISRESLVDDVKSLFSDGTFLEAVFITQNGKQTETLLGIITRWDILKL